jgi:hypothetical protein
MKCTLLLTNNQDNRTAVELNNRSQLGQGVGREGDPLAYPKDYKAKILHPF